VLWRPRPVDAFVAKKRLARVLPTLNPNNELHVLEQAGHSFLTDGHHPVAAALSWPIMHVKYDATLAEEGWSKILSFFDRTLG
jgi:carboxymethylenebutenolidase